MDENEASLLEDEIISNLTDELFENNDEEFIKLVEQFNTPGNEKPFINAVKKSDALFMHSLFHIVGHIKCLNFIIQILLLKTQNGLNILKMRRII